MSERRPMRLRWRRGGEEGYFTGYLGKWLVASLSPYTTAGGKKTDETRWSLPVICHFRALNQRYGTADTPRRAAEKAEEAFSWLVMTQERFDMSTEEELLFRAVLGLPNSGRLDHDIRVEAGEHLLPYDPHDGALARWLEIERAAGRRNWISPEDMKEWYGDRWEDPRQKNLANLRDPGPSSPRRHGSRIPRRRTRAASDTDPTPSR